ncbi:hypothetical protein FHT77_000474 [Rhizobium sp. BK181]|nr:hypothetical protein [Rhizobium sp. BK181]
MDGIQVLVLDVAIVNKATDPTRNERITVFDVISRIL